jgi:hypothetical protein
VAEAAFRKGDRVAWSHEEATKHARGSVLLASALPQSARLGVVQSVENDAGTYFKVKFDDKGKPGELVLTADELVKVADE